MGIVLADNNFELIFQHLCFEDILNLANTSKSLHEIVANSKNCMKKIKLKLTNVDNEEIVNFLRCFRINKRRYRNVVVDCHDNHYVTEKYMLILKTLERTIVDLEISNASFRWDEINTRNFTDQWLILTDLKRLKVKNINDYTAEIFFISCTYLESLHVEGCRLNKYFNYCLRMNERLRELKILQPKGIIFDYEFYGYTSYNFKLHHFEFACDEEMERSKHEFLKRVIYPIFLSQLKFLKSCKIDGVFVDAVNMVICEMGGDGYECKRLKIVLTDECVAIEADALQIKSSGSLSMISDFYKNLSSFMRRACGSLKEVTISLNNNYDEDLTSILFNDYKSIELISIGGQFENIYGGSNDKIMKIETSSMCFEEISMFLKSAPNVKVLTIFELTEELADFIEAEVRSLEVIYYHFINPNCRIKNQRLVKVTSLDPLLRICSDLHNLVYQHLDGSFIDELAQTWTKFYFKP
jgi:hypothetical protein